MTGTPPPNPSLPRPQVPPVEAAIGRGHQRYTGIRAPALAVFAFAAEGSGARPDAQPRNQMKRDQAAAFEAGVPSARVVRLENASHDVFRSNEAEVLREIHDFIGKLPVCCR